ncbi:MAG: hypothetical protein ACYCZX_20175, partial [Rhodospirillaceae bacterium]
TTSVLTGASAATVQHAIDARMLETEEAGGCASFENPRRQEDGTYVSRGEVIVPQAEAAV